MSITLSELENSNSDRLLNPSPDYTSNPVYGPHNSSKEMGPTSQTQGVRSNQIAAFRPLLWLLAIPILNIFYALLNYPGSRAYSLVTHWDRLTPFLPVFVVPYSLWYPLLAFVMISLMLRDRGSYYRLLLAVCMGLVISYITYALFQTTVPRPEITSSDAIHRLLRFIYMNDMPYNCFPSIHVLTSYLMLRGSKQLGTWARWLTAVLSILIIASTLLIKQHVLADVGSGILVAELTYFVSARLMLKRKRAQVAPD